MSFETTARPDALLLLELSEDASKQGLDVYLKRTLELCAEWFRASGASLFLKGPSDDDSYRLAAKAGADSKVPDDARIIPGEGIAGTALEKGEPLLLQTQIESVLLAGGLPQVGRDIGTSMIVPLRTRQFGPLGVLCLSRRKGEPEFSEKDLSAARTLAGQIGLAVANARLFAETVQVQKELGEARRLAEIGQMSAAIAHEIRNPLTGIRGAAQMVESLGAEASELGRIIIEETDKLDRLCSEFLDFARPLNLRFECLPLSEIVARVAAMERPEFECAGVRLSLEILEDAPKIKMDALRIEQVCRNLLRNALQACSFGGQVRVSVEPWSVKVEDDGVGIAEEELPKLFTPFFTTKAHGTGLGLCVVSKIVAAHGGSIEVASVKGEGTTVWIGLGKESTEK